MVDSPDPQPQTVTQKTERTIPAELKPYILGGGVGGEGFFPRALSASEEGLAPLPGAEDRLEPFSTEQQAAFNAFTNRGTQGDPNINAASGFLTSALGEDPSTNPAVRARIEQGQGHLIDQFNTQVAPALFEASRGSGSFGNSSLATIGQSERFNLARALGEVETNTIANERARQAQIAGLAPSLSGARVNDLSNLLNVGSAIQGQGQAGRDINYQNFLDERTANLRNIDILGAALNTAGGGFTNSSTTGQQFLQPGANPFLQALGTGGSFLGGLGLLGSAIFA